MNQTRENCFQHLLQHRIYILPDTRRTLEKSLEDCLRDQKELKGAEGYVIQFKDGRRVKVKTSWYMDLARLLNRMSPISMWEAMSEGKVRQEFIVQLPDELMPLATQYRETLESQYATVRGRLEKEGREIIERFKGDRKQIGLNMKTMDKRSVQAAFMLLKDDQKKLDGLAMSMIYPTANEFVAVKA